MYEKKEVIGRPVEYVSQHGTTVRGYILDEHESPLTGKMHWLIADSPNDDPDEDGVRVDVDVCRFVE